MEQPTDPRLGSHWDGSPCDGGPACIPKSSGWVAYALGGGESCVYLPVRCCQLYFINEAIGAGEGCREYQGHKLRPRDVLGRYRGVQQTQESDFGHERGILKVKE